MIDQLLSYDGFLTTWHYVFIYIANGFFLGLYEAKTKALIKSQYDELAAILEIVCIGEMIHVMRKAPPSEARECFITNYCSRRAQLFKQR